MAITINGSSNTIGGLAVGGLPDGVIDNGCMADDAIGLDDLAATGGRGSGVFLRGDNTWAAAGGGKVIQMKYATTSTEVESTSVTPIDCGLSLNITPTSASNWIHVWGNNYMWANKDWSSVGTGMFLHRAISGGASGILVYPPNASSSNTANANEVHSHIGAGTAGNFNCQVKGKIPFDHIDTTHNTTSQITYKFQFAAAGPNSDRNTKARNAMHNKACWLFAAEIEP
jgi:hypothetical protein